MLGWQIIIYRQQGEGSIHDADTVAEWKTGPVGTQWLDRLVDERLAQQTGINGGYPLRYVARASDLLPHLETQPTPHSGPAIFGDDYVIPTGWKGAITVKQNLVNVCMETNELLTIDAWDQS